MNASYELWDADAGNVVGEFASANEAFDVVSALLGAFGAGYADSLVLQHRTKDLSAPTAVTGVDLIQLVATHRKRQTMVSTGS